MDLGLRPGVLVAEANGVLRGRAWSRTREFLGVLIKDAARYSIALWGPGKSYLKLTNRRERLEPAPDHTGFRCLWRWASDLHAPKIVPGFGLKLLRRALADNPMRLARDRKCPQAAVPRVSFLIGHRGVARLPLLRATVESIGGQSGVDVECIVVEQDVQSSLRQVLPSWVTVIHSPPPSPDMPYSRSWAFNVAARHASGDVLVLHDNDMLVPSNYAAWISERIALGYLVVNPKRFVFYLSEKHTNGVLAGTEGIGGLAPEVVVQNLEGGGSVALTRGAFDSIGGMDESFIGWGGEDSEFWERAQTLRTWSWGGLPIVHLWHAAQPEKGVSESRAVLQYQQLTAIDPTERIARLKSSARGCPSGPSLISLI